MFFLPKAVVVQLGKSYAIRKLTIDGYRYYNHCYREWVKVPEGACIYVDLSRAKGTCKFINDVIAGGVKVP